MQADPKENQTKLDNVIEKGNLRIRVAKDEAKTEKRFDVYNGSSDVPDFVLLISAKTGQGFMRSGYGLQDHGDEVQRSMIINARLAMLPIPFDEAKAIVEQESTAENIKPLFKQVGLTALKMLDDDFASDTARQVIKATFELL